jgi:GNAT superfamily N-acetyltransferase
MSFRAFDLSHPALSEEVRQRLCWRYYDQVYKAAFPVADEAEDPTVWLRLFAQRPAPPEPLLRILFAIADTDSSQTIDEVALLGGIHVEYYRASRAALATYLCVAPHARRQGIARFLLKQAVAAVCQDAGSVSVPLFGEAEDPESWSDPSLRTEARQRLVALSRLGFGEVPIRYRQPPLGSNKRFVDNLKFLLLSAGGSASVKLSTLRAFMDEFYQALGAGKPDETRMFGAVQSEDVATVALGGSQ